MSSSICPHFTQNAWKKDLCSNCFKSKDEHKAAAAAAAAMNAGGGGGGNGKLTNINGSSLKSNIAKTDYPNKHKTPAKSIIKKALSVRSKFTSKSGRVSFQKQLHEVIGYGGEWSDNDSDDDDNDHDFMNLGNEHDDMAATETDDEETVELKRITRANTDFNMNNGNLLGDPQENIKKSFAALKLGAPQVDKEGKKQTLKINVLPFGVTTTTTTTTTGKAAVENGTQASATASKTIVKTKFETKTMETGTGAVATNVARSQTNATASAATTTLTTVSALKTTKKVTTTLTPTLTMGTKTKTSTTTTTTASAAVAAETTTTSLKSKPLPEDDGKASPPIERAMEKSLLDEISETLEKKQNESKKLEEQKSLSNSSDASGVNNKIKFELTSLSESTENKPFLDLKKPIARNPPITKDHAKPKVNVCHKFSDTDSNCSDTENGVSAYYDVVETQISYENLPDGKYTGNTAPKPTTSKSSKAEEDKQAMYSSSQYITDMLLSSKTRAASYNLHEGNFMTSKITSDGLIVTKCSSDDALDSTGSSFDGSSDEETTYNMIRSESDSGIGISIGSEYKNVNARLEKKLSASTNNSDYEDIQIVDQAMVAQSKATKAPAEINAKAKQPTVRKTPFTPEKSRELHGEPDGSADPDNSLEKQTNIQQQQLPALPKSPPPMKIDARPSFLHGLQKQQPILLKKPDLPAKPLVSPVNTPLKTFMPKRQPKINEHQQQQLINQLQSVITKSSENIVDAVADSAKDDAKLKKGRAPNPPPELKSSAPPTPERDYNLVVEFEAAAATQKIPEVQQVSALDDGARATAATKSDVITTHTTTTTEIDSELIINNKHTKTSEAEDSPLSSPAQTPSTPPASGSAISNIYTRKPPSGAGSIANSSVTPAPVIREKDKRERATINPKFRSLNTFVTQRTNAAKNFQLQAASSVLNLKQPMTPEPTPRNHKNLSMSEECLAGAMDKKSPPVKAKTKFSIKKFLRMGSNTKTADNLHKRDSIYTEICTGEDAGVSGKPRLVIIHPIDINPTAVEVVKDITKTSDPVSSQTVAVVTASPPAPPLRATEGQSRPARPPPPKSAELRRKQKTELTATLSASSVDSAKSASPGAGAGSLKYKVDNVYANLGEIRSSIAPRKPERTASMREREAQLELARKRHNHGNGIDTISICSSNGENVSSNNEQQQQQQHQQMSKSLTNAGIDSNTLVDGKPPTGSRTSTFDRKKGETKMIISSKMEIFEQRSNNNNTTLNNQSSSSTLENNRPSSLKDSVRKINNTIDSYLKDKRDYENMYDFVKTASSPPPPPVRNMDMSTTSSTSSNAQRLLLPTRQRNNLYSDIASVASYTRSEYGPVRSTYGLNNSLANIPRMISASYAGSEVGEFDIYAPYSYYGSEAGGDVATDINDSVWGLPSANKSRVKATNRLRMRKGRSVVHKTIEDNYTAVVVANHEALAQVLDQLQQTPVVPLALRPLANAINLRFEDFTILEGAQAFVVGKKAFHAALWTTAPVTLALSADCNQLVGSGGELSQLSGGVSDVLNPITEFCDLVPSYQLPLMPSTEVTLLQATISVLPRLQLETLQSIGTILKGKSHVLDKSNYNFRGSIPNLSGGSSKDFGSALRNVVSVQNLSTLNEESLTNECKSDDAATATITTGANATAMPAFDDVMTREVAFIMLQLVNGMKNLQAKAIEEMPLSLSNVVLSKDVENKDAQARLCVLQGNNNEEDEPMGTLCKCAYIALMDMLPATKISPIVADLLQQERAESLSKAKSVLEFALWGPSDVVLSGSTKERELALQRWLDLERATVLHGLVRTRIELTVYDECHLMFLVRSTAKMMNDAAKIVVDYQQPTSVAGSSGETAKE